MDAILRELRGAISALWTKITSALLSASGPALPITGVLGLAAIVVWYYHLRGTHRRRQIRPHSNGAAAAAITGQEATVQQTPQAHGTQLPREQQSSSVAGSGGPAISSLAQVVRVQLAGARKVTLSSTGVLFHEWQPSLLQEAATLRTEATDLLKEVASCADIYIITHVLDDVGQAVVTGALEAAGLLGHGVGEIRPHKLLFCNTVEGKVSIVRQLEPDLHVDGHSSTIEDLKRFIPQLLHIHQSGTSPAGIGSPNVGSSESLAKFFGQT